MNKQHVDNTLALIRPILEKASTRIEAIPPGQKIPATALADELAKEMGMTGPQLYPTLKFLFNDYPGVDVRAGAHGGIYKLLPGEVKGQKKKSTKTVDSAQSDGDDGAADNK
jgi:hypothetical protein